MYQFFQGLGMNGIIVIGIIVVVVMFLIPLLFNPRKGQNRVMQRYIDEYNRLASSLGANPPEVPEYNGFKASPILRIVRDWGQITITPTTFYHTDMNPSIVQLNPYQEIEMHERSAQMGMGMQVLDAMLGGSRSHYRRYHRKSSAQMITLARMSLPQRLRGSRILITPETFIGKLIGFTEIKIDYAGFDTAFKVRGSDESAVRAFLTPEVCQALLDFKGAAGAFQLNENELIWSKINWDTNGVSPVVGAMERLGQILNK